MIQKVMEDWKIVSTDYQMRAQRYAEIGKQVQVVYELFQTCLLFHG